MEGSPVFGKHAELIGILSRPLRQRTSAAEIQVSTETVLFSFLNHPPLNLIDVCASDPLPTNLSELTLKCVAFYAKTSIHKFAAPFDAF